MSDISNGHGSHICSNYINGEKDPNRLSKYVWPCQIKPTKKEWQVWERCIDTIWRPKLFKHKKLGQYIWDSHQVFHWKYDKHNQRLYNKCKHNIRCFIGARANRTTSTLKRFDFEKNCNIIPDNCEDATIQVKNRNTIYFTGSIPPLEEKTNDQHEKNKWKSHLK